MVARRSVFLLGLMFIGLPAGVARGATVQREVTCSGPVDAGGHCELAIINGSVRVRRSPDGVCRLKAVIRASGGTPAQAREAAERTTIDHYTDRHVFRAYVKQGDAGFLERIKRVVANWRSTSAVEVDYAVELPVGVEVRVNSVNGRVSVDGATAGVGVQTVSGVVSVATCDGDLSLKTVSGPITGEAMRGRINVTTVSGSVNVALVADGKGGGISTVSGNVELLAPAGASLRVHTQTLSGAVTNAFEGAGTMDVDIKTVSGDIHARKH